MKTNQVVSREEEDFLETAWEDCAFRRLEVGEIRHDGDYMWPKDPVGNMAFPGLSAPQTVLLGTPVGKDDENWYYRCL